MSLQHVLVFPAVLLLTFGPIQASYWYLARALCLHAAEAGVRAGRELGGDTEAATNAANDYIARTGPDLVDSVHVSTDGTTIDRVRVEVTAQVPVIFDLPGLDWQITQSATAPRERFTEP